MSDLTIFQLGRLGDLVQVLPVVKRWQEQRAGKVCLVHDERYTAVANTLFADCNIIPVNVQLLPEYAVDLRSGLGRAGITHSSVIAALERASGDTHLILSDLPAATEISKLLTPVIQLGYSRECGVHSQSAMLKEYLRGIGEIRPWPLHLIDIWSLLAGLCLGQCKESKSLNSELSDIKRIAVIFDAGNPGRTPDTSWMLSLTAKLLNELPCELYLIGVKRVDHEQLPINTAGNSRLYDLRGRTSIAELVELLSETQLAIGPDTGSLHLASALGNSTIGLYTGGAAALNTGPYAQSSVVLHDLEWNERELHSVLRQAAAMLNSPTDVYRQPEWWYPAFDDSGILYTSDSLDAVNLSALRDLRYEFLATRETLHDGN